MKVEHKIKDRENGCPLGHKCDSCNLYTPLYLHNRSNEVVQVWDCSLNNMLVLIAESKDGLMRVQQAVESRGNETIKRQDQFLSLVSTRQQRLHNDKR